MMRPPARTPPNRPRRSMASAIVASCIVLGAIALHLGHPSRASHKARLTPLALAHQWGYAVQRSQKGSAAITGPAAMKAARTALVHTGHHASHVLGPLLVQFGRHRQLVWLVILTGQRRSWLVLVSAEHATVLFLHPEPAPRP